MARGDIYAVLKGKTATQITKIDRQSGARRWELYRELLKQRLTARAQQLYKTFGRKFTYRVCCCGIRWPACPPFFTMTEKVTRTGKHLYLGRICPLCRNTRRRDSKSKKRKK